MMTTTIHVYRYDISNPKDATAYQALCAKMEAQGTKCFESWGGGGSHHKPSLDGVQITLETEHIFDNQWNTAPIPGVTDKGLRVFDWAMDYKDWGRSIKQGHYLDLTPEMVEVRENRLKCGYCGKQYNKRNTPPPPAFCNQCLGSEYLKENELYLTRVIPVTSKTFTPLTTDEQATLLPAYHAEQEGKGSERSRKARETYGERLKKEHDAKVAELTVKYNGLKWLFDHGCSVRLMKNCIYYSHLDTFTFGWSEPLHESSEDMKWLYANMSEFPYTYDLKKTNTKN